MIRQTVPTIPMLHGLKIKFVSIDQHRNTASLVCNCARVVEFARLKK